MKFKMINEKYSFKDFTGKTFLDVDPKEFDGIIKGSCFYNQLPFSNVFPKGIKTRFIGCNLDNCNIPVTADISNDGEDRNSNKMIDVQTDLQDWLVDKNGNAIKPLGERNHTELGLSKNPKDLPKKYIREKVVPRQEYEERYVNNGFPADSWFKEEPIVVKSETKTLKTLIPSLDKSTIIEADVDVEYVTLRAEGKLRRDW